MFEMTNLLLYIALCTSITREVTPQLTIDTIPALPNNVLATGYSGLIIRAQVKKDDVNYRCVWKYAGEFNDRAWFHPILFGCRSLNGINETFNCDEVTRNGVDYVISNLTFKQPVTSNFNVTVLCEFGLYPKTVLVNVQKCSSIVSSQLVVTSLENRYDSTGTFKCLNNGKLFYFNKTKVPNSQTTCLASASWRGHDDLQCWRDPDPRITGNFAGKAGTKIELICGYWEVIPVGNYSVFNFRNMHALIRKGQKFTTILQPEDNNKVVSCQAITPYTEIYKETGRSPNYVINVQYKPYQNYITSCTWLINKAGWCNVTFLANPKPRYISLNKNGLTINNAFTNTIFYISESFWKFSFYKHNVTSADSGVYTLRVKSSVFDEDSTIVFDISVETNPDLNNQSNDLTSSVIVISCIAGLLLVFLVGLLILLIRQRRMTKQIVSQNKKSIPLDDGEYVNCQPGTSTTPPCRQTCDVPNNDYLNLSQKSIKDKKDNEQYNADERNANDYVCLYEANNACGNTNVDQRKDEIYESVL